MATPTRFQNARFPLRGRPLAALLLAALAGGGCGPDMEANTINNAIIAHRAKKDEMSIVRTVAKERRMEARGLYSFYDAEEPSGRPFVVQTRQRLNYNHEYLLLGRMAPWPKGFKGHEDLFVMEDFVTTFPWLGIVIGIGLIAAALFAYRNVGLIRSFFVQNIKPPEEKAPIEETEMGPRPGFDEAPVRVSIPSLTIEPGTPATVSNFNTFHLPFDDERKDFDGKMGQNCTVYTFGRADDANDFVLKERYVTGLQHFRVTVYEDSTAYLEVNPLAKTSVVLREPGGQMLALAPDYPQLLRDGSTVTIGDIKLRYSAPSA